jgi:hypothetical protein
MSLAGTLASGTVGGATTMLVRTAARKAMHGRDGAPRLPSGVRRQRGIGTMIAWAAAAGVLLALADLLLEQRSESMRPGDEPAF